MINYAGATAPAGWLLCNGAAVSRFVFATLFSVIGTAYGVGDGSTTFNLPNTAGRVVRGVNGTYTRGGTGGADTTTLTIANLPPHSHTLWRGGAQANQGSTNSDWIGTPNADTGAATGGTIYQATDTPTSGSRTAVVQQDGTGQTATPIANTWVGVNYIIKV
jgi:microcystin-dependent protein